MKTFFKDGSWNAICDVCGFQYKAEDMRKRWDGAMVCEKDFEFRNPQEFIRIPKEEISPEWARPVPPYVYTSITYRPINSTTKDVVPP